MKLTVTDKGKIELDMWEIIKEVVGNTPDDELWSLVEMLGWQKRVLKMVSIALAEAFSRDNYNTSIHEARDLFLKHIKQEEIKYYASVIANKQADAQSYSEKYWKLYHWCSGHAIFSKYNDAPSIFSETKLDFKYELEKTIEQAFLDKMPEVKDG